MTELMRRRRALMGIQAEEKQPLPELPALPSGYQRVEYIETTGTQYIYGPTFSTSKTNITIWYMPTVKGGRMFYHAGTSGFSRDIYVGSSSGGLFFSSTNMYTAYSNEYGTRYNTFTATFTSGYSGNRTPYIMCQASGTNMYAGKFYGLKVSTRYLVPCYRISDGVIGAYATAESKFYENAGTGIFGKGADVA